VTVLLVEGEQFPAPVAETAPGPAVEPPRSLFLSRAAWFVLGLLIGLLIAASGAWFSRGLWEPPVVEAPRVLLVGSGGQFASITAALAEARRGDTVEVPIGEYREQVTLKSGVNLRSTVPREAILRAAPLSTGPAVVGESVKDVRISGFLIQADEKMPLSAGISLKGSDVLVEDVEVSGAGIGIAIRGGNVALIGNAVHDCTGEGVSIAGASTPWISHNSIQRNKGAGLAAREGARPSLVGNVFEKNALDLPADISMDVVKAKNFLLDVGAAGRGPQSRAVPAAPHGGKKQ
jgi:hypothetical protein